MTGLHRAESRCPRPTQSRTSQSASRFAVSAIREARKALLAPLLAARGYRLRPAGNGNYTVLPALRAAPERFGGGGSPAEGPDPADPEAPIGLVLKQHFWIWPDRNLAGNAIDFFVKVEGKTFHQAMEIITEATSYDPSEQTLREEPGNDPKTLR